MGRVVQRKPPWAVFRIPGGASYTSLKGIIDSHGLRTVCSEARCPNRAECHDAGTATFLVLGDRCTRNCRYCSIEKGEPLPPDAGEPARVAQAVKSLNLKYAVITSVTRDDIADGGASHFAAVICEIRSIAPECGVEVLVPDFRRNMEYAVQTIAACSPRVINHNIEVARSKFRELRPGGNYDASLTLLRIIAQSGTAAKSGLMVGFGESMLDVRQTLEDVHSTGCEIITVGQYLQSHRSGYQVEKFYHPDEFKEIEAMARSIGFTKILAGPLVRSSYHAGGA